MFLSLFLWFICVFPVVCLYAGISTWAAHLLFLLEAILYHALEWYIWQILLVNCSVTFLFLALVPYSVPLSLPPSIHPPIWLRWGAVGRGEWSEGWSDSWSPVRQGETNYPSNERHSSSLHFSLLSLLPSSTLRCEMQHTWMVTPKKLYTLCCFHLVPWAELPRQSARSSINITENNEEKEGERAR